MEAPMARKEQVSRQMLTDAAFRMTKEQGITEVTARKLAAFAGCSTQPIFRHFQSMEDLYAEVFRMAMTYYDDFYDKQDKLSKYPFVNLGLSYIKFAEKEPKLFSFLFMTKNDLGVNLYNLLNGRNGSVLEEMNRAKTSGDKDPEGVFMKMWMLIHGAACMTITGDYDLSAAQTRLQLEEAYKAFTR